MKFKQSRIWSFFIVVLVYLFATVVGIITYLSLPYAFWLNLLIADIVATIITFLFSLIFSNASVYDPYWSVQPIVILIAFALKSQLSLVQILPIIAVLFWGIRLTANWAYTFHGLKHQDWRYTMLKDKTGTFYPLINFIGIHLVPTLVVYGCILPAVYIIRQKPDFNIGSIFFFLVSIGAVILQGTSDIQMHKFRSSGQRGFIKTGLWQYSRHPNYLGEILMWWGIGLSAVFVMPSQWHLILGAVSNTLLFFCISIPLADGRQSAKEGFEEYKQSTHMLLPIKIK